MNERRFDDIAEEELDEQALQHDPLLAADVPSSMHEGNRGGRSTIVYGGVALAAIVAAVLLFVIVRAIFVHPTSASGTGATNTFTSDISQVAQGGNVGGMLFGNPDGSGTCGPGYHTAYGTCVADATASPAPGTHTAPPTTQPLTCTNGYHVVQAPGYPPTCVANNTGSTTTTTTTGTPAGAPPVPTPTPSLPPQQIDVAQPPVDAAQAAQAQGDIAARTGRTASTSSTSTAPPQSVPVYNNGQIVAYQVPPAGNITSTNTTQRSVQSTTAISVGYVDPVSEDQIGAGTVIPSALISNVNSDLPGTFIGQVTACVYDSKTHTHCVIPPGTIETGTYDARLVAGQTRMLGAIETLRFPNGREFDLGESGQEGTDAMGAAGFTGHVDTHGRQVINSALLLTLLGGASAALSPQQGGSVFSAPTITQQIQEAAGAQIANVGSRIIGTQIGRAPTITISPPYQFDVLVTRDLPLDRYEVAPQRGRVVPATPAPVVAGPTRFCC